MKHTNYEAEYHLDLYHLYFQVGNYKAALEHWLKQKSLRGDKGVERAYSPWEWLEKIELLLLTGNLDQAAQKIETAISETKEGVSPSNDFHWDDNQRAGLFRGYYLKGLFLGLLGQID